MLVSRVSPAIYITFLILYVIAVIFQIQADNEASRPHDGMIEFYYFCLLIVAPYLWFRYYRLTVTETFIVYRVPLRKTKSLALNNIISYETIIGGNTGADRWKPFLRLSIKSKKALSDDLDIPLIFPEADFKKLKAILDDAIIQHAVSPG